MKRTTSFLAVVSLALVLPVVALADTGTSGTSAPAKSDNSAAMKQEGTTAAAPATTPAATTSKSTTHKTHATTHKPKMDLNTATKEELMTLPGVTEDAAEKIIAARPFKSKGQLESEKILTKAEYNKVASKVTVKTASTSKAK